MTRGECDAEPDVSNRRGPAESAIWSKFLGPVQVDSPRWAGIESTAMARAASTAKDRHTRRGKTAAGGEEGKPTAASIHADGDIHCTRLVKGPEFPPHAFFFLAQLLHAAGTGPKVRPADRRAERDPSGTEQLLFRLLAGIATGPELGPRERLTGAEPMAQHGKKQPGTDSPRLARRLRSRFRGPPIGRLGRTSAHEFRFFLSWQNHRSW